MQILMQRPTVAVFTLAILAILGVLVVARESWKRDIGKSRHARFNGPGRNLVMNRRRNDTAEGDEGVNDDRGVHD